VPLEEVVLPGAEVLDPDDDRDVHLPAERQDSAPLRPDVLVPLREVEDREGVVRAHVVPGRVLPLLGLPFRDLVGLPAPGLIPGRDGEGLGRVPAGLDELAQEPLDVLDRVLDERVGAHPDELADVVPGDRECLVERVRVIGTYTGYSSNFIVWVGGDLLVNELLGTGWGQTRYDGTLLTTGGVVEIIHSSGVSWSFTEVSPINTMINFPRLNIWYQSIPNGDREFEIYKRASEGKR